MDKKARWILIVLVLAAALSAAALLTGGPAPAAPVAQLLRAGEVVDQIRLDQVEEGYSFVLEDALGSNTVQVEPGRIRIVQADCPDQVCVRQGWIEDGTRPIVCLPHKLTIQILGGEEALDGATG